MSRGLCKLFQTSLVKYSKLLRRPSHKSFLFTLILGQSFLPSTQLLMSLNVTNVSILPSLSLYLKEYQRLVNSDSQGRDYAQLNNKEAETQVVTYHSHWASYCRAEHILNVFQQKHYIALSLQNSSSKYTSIDQPPVLYLQYIFSLKQIHLSQK